MHGYKPPKNFLREHFTGNDLTRITGANIKEARRYHAWNYHVAHFRRSTCDKHFYFNMILCGASFFEAFWGWLIVRFCGRRYYNQCET